MSALINFRQAERHLRKSAAVQRAMLHLDALETTSDYAQAHRELGHVWVQRGELSQAESCFRAALAERPDDAAAHCGLGAALMAQRRFDESEDVYREARKLQPSCAEARAGIAAALLAQGRRTAARSFF